MIVLDASAALERLLAREAAGTVADRFRNPRVTVQAPSLLGVEVACALQGLVLGKHTTTERASIALTDLLSADIALHDPALCCPATLVTTDARIAKAPGLRTTIDVVAPAERVFGPAQGDASAV